MTKKAKLITMAILALISSFAIMMLLHILYGPGFMFMLPMSGMAWMMIFGFLAMILFFGGAVTLIVLFVRFLSESGQRQDPPSGPGV